MTFSIKFKIDTYSVNEVKYICMYIMYKYIHIYVSTSVDIAHTYKYSIT
jgi:hypothetical protein